jgi:hypothetical protein
VDEEILKSINSGEGEASKPFFTCPLSTTFVATLCFGHPHKVASPLDVHSSLQSSKELLLFAPP